MPERTSKITSGSMTGPDKAAAPPRLSAPADILRALDQHQAQRGGPDARQSPRQFLCVPANLEIRDSSAAAVRNAGVATNNISTGGFGFIFDAHLRPGTLLRARFDSLPGKPCIDGIVRSSVRICGTQHRIGVEFER